MKKLIGIVIVLIIQQSTFDSQCSYAQIPNDNVGSGNCLDFDGINDFVGIPHNPIFDFGSGDFTIEFWMKSNDNSTDEKWLLSKNTDGWRFWGFSNRNIQDRISFEIWNGGFPSHQATSTTIFNDNIWKHVSVTRTSGTVRLYVNGIEEGSFTSNRSMNFNGGIEVGRMTTWGNLAAQVDEIRIWNIARTQTQIQENLCIKLQGNEPGLVGYWNMNEGTGNTVSDLTTNANHGTRQ